MKSKPCMLKVSIYRLGQSRGALFQQYKSYLQLMAKSWPHEKKKSKSVTSHSALLLFRTQSQMTKFSLYSQETRQFTWCHKLCQAQFGVIFSDMGHWLENCEMRARHFCVGSRESEAAATRPVLAQHKRFLGQLWFPPSIGVVCLLMDWLSGHFPTTERAGSTIPAAVWRWASQARLREHPAQGQCQAPPMPGPGEWPFHLLRRQSDATTSSRNTRM